MSASTGTLICMGDLIEARPSITASVGFILLDGRLARQTNLMLRAVHQAKS